MKDVLFLSHAAGFGGAEIFMRDLILRSNSEGAGWEAAFLQDGPIAQELICEGIKVNLLPLDSRVLSLKRGSRLRDIFPAIYGLASSLKNISRLVNNYAIICANSQKALFLGALAARSRRKKFVWIMHDLLDDHSFSPIMRKAVVYFANYFCDAVVANSLATKAALISCGVDRKIISVIYNGFDFSDQVFNVDAKQLKMSIFGREKFDSSATVGLFGRVAHWKGQHVLIEALKEAPGIQAIIVGDATYQNQEYFTQLQKSIDLCGMRDRIKLLGFRSDVVDLIRLVDIVVHTSIDPEPFGRVIVESMAQGKPVIAARGGGVPEIIEHEKTGILVESADSKALARAILALVDNHEQFHRIGRAGQDAVRRKFRLEVTVASFRALFGSFSSPSSATTRVGLHS